MDLKQGCTTNLISMNVNPEIKDFKELNIEHPRKIGFFANNTKYRKNTLNPFNLVKTRSQKSHNSYKIDENQENLDPNFQTINKIMEKPTKILKTENIFPHENRIFKNKLIKENKREKNSNNVPINNDIENFFALPDLKNELQHGSAIASIKDSKDLLNCFVELV